MREAAAAARPRQSRIGRVAEPKNFAKRPKEGGGVARPRYSPIRVGLWRQKLYGAGEEVREPQGSRALNVRLNRRAQTLCGEVEKRVQGSQDSGAFGSVGSWSLRTPWRSRTRTHGP